MAAGQTSPSATTGMPHQQVCLLCDVFLHPCHAQPIIVLQAGLTALHYAAWQGSVDAVELLLEKSSNVNVADPVSGQTLLLAACTPSPPCVCVWLPQHKHRV
jgi:hypothetical protein